jgi:hypothetical protein
MAASGVADGPVIGINLVCEHSALLKLTATFSALPLFGMLQVVSDGSDMVLEPETPHPWRLHTLRRRHGRAHRNLHIVGCPIQTLKAALHE